MTNDQPMRIHVKVEPDLPIKTLLSKVTGLRDTNVEVSSQKTELIVFSMQQKTKHVKTIF